MPYYVPSKYTSTRYFQPWITQKCKQLSRQKKSDLENRLVKRLSKSANWERFKRLTKESRKTYQHLTALARTVSAQRGSKKSCKKLFSFIKSCRCENDGVQPLSGNGCLHIDNNKKANIVNKQFSIVIPDGHKLPLQGPANTPMTEITITKPGVRKLSE
eukprot:TCONS_00033882-protein